MRATVGVLNTREHEFSIVLLALHGLRALPNHGSEESTERLVINDVERLVSAGNVVDDPPVERGEAA